SSIPLASPPTWTQPGRGPQMERISNPYRPSYPINGPSLPDSTLGQAVWFGCWWEARPVLVPSGLMKGWIRPGVREALALATQSDKCWRRFLSMAYRSSISASGYSRLNRTSSVIEGLPSGQLGVGFVRGASQPYRSLKRAAICWADPGLKGCSLVRLGPFTSFVPLGASFLNMYLLPASSSHQKDFISSMTGGKV